MLLESDLARVEFCIEWAWGKPSPPGSKKTKEPLLDIQI
jgi:hypothetical protein